MFTNMLFYIDHIFSVTNIKFQINHIKMIFSSKSTRSLQSSFFDKISSISTIFGQFVRKVTAKYTVVKENLINIINLINSHIFTINQMLFHNFGVLFTGMELVDLSDIVIALLISLKLQTLSPRDGGPACRTGAGQLGTGSRSRRPRA
jgi:hypothetical protein